MYRKTYQIIRGREYFTRKLPSNVKLITAKQNEHSLDEAAIQSPAIATMQRLSSAWK